jgi:phosphate transport system substrate-binding protein
MCGEFRMEKKIMYITVAVIAILLVAGIGAAVLLSNNSNNNPETLKIITIKANAGAVAYSPLDQDSVLRYANNSANGGYALSRYLYLYTSGNATGAEWTWLHWILTTGQTDVVSAGFYSLPANVQSAMLAQLGAGPGSSTGSITQSGSTTMEEMANLWQNDSKVTYPGITVSLNYPGSGAGIQNLMDGKVDIAQASRAMKPSEKGNMTAHGHTPVEFKVAVDGIAIVVNSDNNITTLTLDQLKQIYNGNYTNWNQVGGKNEAISLYGRDSASGTGDFFNSAVLGGKAPIGTMQQMPSTALVVQQCKDNKGSIGYVGIGYAKEGTASQTLMEGGNSVLSLIQLSETKPSLA